MTLSKIPMCSVDISLLSLMENIIIISLQYEVTMKFSKNSGPYTTCGLILRHTKLKKERLVWHLQYTDWPDHGCPEDPHGFLGRSNTPHIYTGSSLISGLYWITH